MPHMKKPLGDCAIEGGDAAERRTRVRHGERNLRPPLSSPFGCWCLTCSWMLELMPTVSKVNNTGRKRASIPTRSSPTPLKGGGVETEHASSSSYKRWKGSSMAASYLLSVAHTFSSVPLPKRYLHLARGKGITQEKAGLRPFPDRAGQVAQRGPPPPSAAGTPFSAPIGGSRCAGPPSPKSAWPRAWIACRSLGGQPGRDGRCPAETGGGELMGHCGRLQNPKARKGWKERHPSGDS